MKSQKFINVNALLDEANRLRVKEKARMISVTVGYGGMFYLFYEPNVSDAVISEIPDIKPGHGICDYCDKEVPKDQLGPPSTCGMGLVACKECESE